MAWKVKEIDGEKEREVNSRSEAEDVKAELEQLDMNVEIVSPDKSTDGGTEAKQAEVVDSVPPQENVPQTPDKSVSDDPIEWVPEHFVDEIQGVPTINRKGYCVLAEQYNVSVVAEPVTLASETDFEYAEFKAIAETEGGQEYSGFGSAHVDRQDGDDEHLLNELAETRALKRATAWATGIGMTAVEELKHDL